MATITKRDSGKWQAKVRRLGQPVTSKSFQTKEDAEKWARAIEREMDTQSYVANDTAKKTLMKDVLERYRDEVLPRLSKGALPDKSRINRLIEEFGGLTLSALDTSHAAAFRDKRLYTEEAAPQTVKRELGLLNRVLKACSIDWGIHLPRGLVTEMIRKPTLPPGRDRRLEAGEEERLLEVARASRSDDIEPMIIIALETAARRGEILNMCWKHVDLKKRTWRIPETKTGVPRTVPLSTRAITVLSSLKKRERIDGRVWDLKREDGVTQAFDRICRPTVTVKGKKKKIDKFPNLHFHDLRHEATSRLFEKGFNIMEVASITGHRDLSMLRRYTHLRAEDLAERLK